MVSGLGLFPTLAAMVWRAAGAVPCQWPWGVARANLGASVWVVEFPEAVTLGDPPSVGKLGRGLVGSRDWARVTTILRSAIWWKELEAGWAEAGG